MTACDGGNNDDDNGPGEFEDNDDEEENGEEDDDDEDSRLFGNTAVSYHDGSAPQTRDLTQKAEFGGDFTGVLEANGEIRSG